MPRDRGSKTGLGPPIDAITRVATSFRLRPWRSSCLQGQFNQLSPSNGQRQERGETPSRLKQACCHSLLAPQDKANAPLTAHLYRHQVLYLCNTLLPPDSTLLWWTCYLLEVGIYLKSDGMSVIVFLIQKRGWVAISNQSLAMILHSRLCAMKTFFF